MDIDDPEVGSVAERLDDDGASGPVAPIQMDGLQAVTLDPDLYTLASTTAALFGRTVPEQIEIWVRLGQALERQLSLENARTIMEVSGGRLPPNALAHMQNDSMKAAVAAYFMAPDEEMNQRYRELAAADEEALRCQGSGS